MRTKRIKDRVCVCVCVLCKAFHSSNSSLSLFVYVCDPFFVFSRICRRRRSSFTRRPRRPTAAADHGEEMIVFLNKALSNSAPATLALAATPSPVHVFGMAERLGSVHPYPHRFTAAAAAHELASLLYLTAQEVSEFVALLCCCVSVRMPVALVTSFSFFFAVSIPVLFSLSVDASLRFPRCLVRWRYCCLHCLFASPIPPLTPRTSR